jgi:glycosyltransferase involved in cell wall biosynthesis
MLITVELCTHNRREYLAEVVDCYLSQIWKDKELLVIDDGSDRCRDLFDRVPAQELAYVYLDTPAKNLSAKRNIAATLARGEIIVHFDSDDWAAPTRINHQVESLISSGSEVGGYHTAHFWDEAKAQASCYLGSKNYSWGAALCYLKSFAIQHPWPENITVAEDNCFVGIAQRKKLITAIDGRGQMVARIQGEKASNTTNWPLVAVDELPEAFRKIIRR